MIVTHLYEMVNLLTQTVLRHPGQSYWFCSPSLSLVTDSPINSTNSIHRKTKTNGIDHGEQTKSCHNMKSIVSPKQLTTTTTASGKRVNPDYSDMERNNIYAETPPKVKTHSASSISPPTLVNGTNHYMPLLQQRRPPNIPVRLETPRTMMDTSSCSVSSFSTATCSSQSTTPSNSFRHDAASIMTRSADASSSCGLINQSKNATNSAKSKSTYDIDTSLIANTDRPKQQQQQQQQTRDTLNGNSKCLNTITNGNFVPLQSVKEDECLVVEHDCNQKCGKVRVTRARQTEQSHLS